MKPLYILLSITTLVLTCSCTSENKVEAPTMAADNPFNVSLNEPIAYGKLTPKHIDDYINTTITTAAKDIQKIKSLKDLSFTNTFGQLDATLNAINKAGSSSYMMYDVATDSLIRDAGNKGYIKLDSLYTDISTDRDLYKQLKAFATSDNGKKLTGTKKVLMTTMLQDLEHNGINLNTDDVQAFKQLKSEIASLTTEFTTNMNAADEFLLLNEKETEGLPNNFKLPYLQEDKTYKIPVNNATREPVLNNATASEVRKAYTVKLYNIAADKNVLILDSLLSKRYQLAQLMGYNSYAAYALENRMAKTPKRVWDFLNNLAEASKEKALEDISNLQKIRNATLKTPNNTSPLDPWDMAYYKSILLKTKYHVDAEKIREYLPMDRCLEGMLAIYQQLLGFTFKKVTNPSVWAPDVELYEVYENNTLRGRFYLDLYPRAYKNTWFYALPLVMGKQTVEGYEIPQAMLLGNFTKPTSELPSLISMYELETLFHEFGHIMDCMSYEGTYHGLSNTKDDFVESMSQIFENWIEDYSIVSSFATHYKTGEVFPKTLFENSLQSKNATSGINVQSGIRYALYDMYLYDTYTPKAPIDTDALWNDVDTKMGVMHRNIKGTHRQANIIHLNTHPVYLYGYIWSNVYAEDMFTVFKENGLLDTQTGIKYRKLILANGSQKDIDKALEDFLGRPSNAEAYIKSLGLE